MTRPLTTRLLGLVACAAVTVATGARAQADLRAPPKAAAAEKTPASRPSSGKKVIKLDALTVEGRIQKPEAFYVLPRSSLNFDELQKSESFVTKIDQSVLKDPF